MSRVCYLQYQCTNFRRAFVFYSVGISFLLYSYTVEMMDIRYNDPSSYCNLIYDTLYLIHSL